MIFVRETTARGEEEGVEEEEGREEGATGLARAASEGFTCAHFAASCSALRRIDSSLMAPMI